MKRRKIVKHPIIVSRWANWAEQFLQRLGRMSTVAGVQPLWRLPALARARTFFQQRHLLAYLRLQPQLNLSISTRNIWNAGAPNIYAPEFNLLRLFTGKGDAWRTFGSRREGRPAAAFVLPRQKPETITPVFARPKAQLAMAQAIARTQKEYLSTDFHRRLLVHRQNDLTEVSRRLTHRTERRHELSEVTELRQLVSLRKQAPTPAPSQPRAGAAPEFAPVERSIHAPAFSEIGMPAVNVEQLANQVMKHIDRRVIARRERMGQI